jgi:hypothetical protein
MELGLDEEPVVDPAACAHHGQRRAGLEEGVDELGEVGGRPDAV